jgi:hypothetical protein
MKNVFRFEFFILILQKEICLAFFSFQARTYYIVIEYNDMILFVNQKRFNNGRLKSLSSCVRINTCSEIDR